MNLEQYGVQAVCEMAANGTLLVDLVTNQAIQVSINGKPVTGVQSNKGTKFWSADGTQTDTPPIDLRGAQ